MHIQLLGLPQNRAQINQYCSLRRNSNESVVSNAMCSAACMSSSGQNSLQVFAIIAIVGFGQCPACPNNTSHDRLAPAAGVKWKYHTLRLEKPYRPHSVNLLQDLLRGLLPGAFFGKTLGPADPLLAQPDLDGEGFGMLGALLG